MKSKISYQTNDKVLVKSFGGPDVCVTLNERYIANQSEHKLGVDGWYATITLKKYVDKLRKSGVPYSKGEKPSVFVADWQIIKRC